MPYTYILECSDGTYYVGSTKDMQRRLEEHTAGMGAKYTSKRLPVKLVYVEEFERIDEAFIREHQIKVWTHAKKKALVEGNIGKLELLSKRAARVIR